MAHSDQPNSGTIHFFIMLGPAHHLDGKYTPFAKVVSGIEVAEAISRQTVSGEQLTPPVIITRVVVEQKKP
jgi:cyclophilin family peptidyl-prolyl cis-trans isomerase